MKARPPLHASMPRHRLGSMVFQRQALAFRLRRHSSAARKPAAAHMADEGWETGQGVRFVPRAARVPDPFTVHALALLRPPGDGPR